MTIEKYKDFVERLENARNKYDRCYGHTNMIPPEYEKLRNSALDILKGGCIVEGINCLENLSDSSLGLGVILVNLILDRFKYKVAYS